MNTLQAGREETTMACVIVLGLPRGGTSAVAGVLHHLGVHMGDELMPAFHVNPKGFFEDMDFVDRHNRLLGGHDKDPEDRFLVPPGHPAWDAYARLIRGKTDRPLWGVKDPKMCFLLPHFLRLLGPDTRARAVVVRRRFHDSVHSYSKLWGGVPHDEVLRRLGHYQYSLARNLAALPPAVPVHELRYEELCERPHAAVGELCGFLGVDPRPAAVRFVDPELNRTGRAATAAGT